MPNIGLLPSLHVFSLTHHSLDLCSYQCFSVSVSLLLTFTPPAPSSMFCHSPFFPNTHTFYPHTLASLFVTHHLRPILPPPVCSSSSLSRDDGTCPSRPHSPTQVATATAPVPPRVLCDTGRRGWMAWELIGGRRVAEGTDCMALQTSGWPEREPGGCPLALSHVTRCSPHGKTRA